MTIRLTSLPIASRNRGLIRLLVGLIIIMALSKSLTAYGQGNVDTLTRMEVTLWPDYDRPSVLATLIGSLPSGTPFPVTITLPIPEDATINAVAPILPDGRPGVEMSYDDSVPGQITFSTDVSGFWVELASLKLRFHRGSAVPLELVSIRCPKDVVQLVSRFSMTVFPDRGLFPCQVPGYLLQRLRSISRRDGWISVLSPSENAARF